MNVLQVDNSYSYLISQDRKLLEIIWKHMRFREKDYFHSPRYKMKLWDGFVDFFDKNTGRFLTGLLPEVKLALHMLGHECKIVDNRNPLEFAVKSIDKNFLKSVELRDYQVGYINQVIRNKRGIIYAPTSSGKTLTLVGIIAALPKDTPTLVLANRKSLIEQNYDEIRKFGFENVGKFYGDCKQANIITCATVQSCHLLKRLLPKIRVLIVDEIHEMMSKKPRSVYRQCKEACVRVGMSATPFTFGEKDKVQKFEVKGFIGPVFEAENTETGKLTTKELQKRKILSSSECFIRPVRTTSLEFYTYTDAVTEGIALNEEFHQMNVKLVEKLTGRILIIVERIPHGDRLSELIPGSLWVRGKDDLETRKSIIEQLKTNKEKTVAIATAGIFNTGINVFVNHLINSAGGQAEHQIIQRIGRGLRRAEDKEHLQYHDWIFYNNDYLEKHSRKRISIYEKEGHKVHILKELDL